MNPLKITMQAFGPYLEKSCVDFSKLADNRIFLITGTTGSGKTTILDAMCFALYCRATGGLRTWSDMRNIAANDNIDTYVDFEFNLGEKKYRFRRVLRVHYNRSSKEKGLKEEHECFIKEEDNDWSLLISGKEKNITNYAEELIGLNCEQFSRVIVLPQGEFKNLLISNSTEKAKIFQKLFSTQHWNLITDTLKCMVTSLVKQLDETKTAMDTILSHENTENFETLKDKKLNTEKNYLSIKNDSEELSKIIENTNEEIKTLEKMDLLKSDLKNLENKLKEAEIIFKNETILLENVKNEFAKMPHLREELKAHDKQILKLENNLQNMKKIENIKKEEKGLINTLHNIQSEKNLALQRSIEAAKNLKKGEKHINHWNDLVQETPSLIVKINTLREITDAYEKLGEYKTNFESYQNKYNNIKRSIEGKQTLLETLDTSLKNYQEELNSDVAYILSQNLEKEKPCPVCGSTSHPKPAVHRKANINATKEKINSLKAEICSGENMLKTYRLDELNYKSKLDEFSKLYEKQSKICNGFNIYYKTAEDDLEVAKASLKKSQEAQSQLKKAADRMKLRESEHKAALETLDKSCFEESELLKKIAILKSQHDAILGCSDCSISKLRDIEHQLKLSKNESKQIEDVLNSIEKRLADVKTNFKIAESELGRLKAEKAEAESKYNSEILINDNLKETDKEILMEKLKVLKERDRNLFSSLGEISQEINSVKKSIDEIEKLKIQYNAAVLEYSRTNRVFSLLQGNNKLKTPIKMFALGIMLDEVLSRANIYYTNLSSSRYSLSRVCERIVGRGFNGLDLEVFDAYYGSTRPIATLSGGELFLASLSLAFGLSDTVQCCSGGVHLDSIFIDEGFGSLDQETLDVAIKALDCIQKTGRTVGIISHVEELKSRILTKIDINEVLTKF